MEVCPEAAPELDPNLPLIKKDIIKEELEAPSRKSSGQTIIPPLSTGEAASSAVSTGHPAPTGGSAPAEPLAVPMDIDWISTLDPDRNLGLTLWPSDSASNVVPIMEKLVGLARRREESLQPCLSSDRPVASMISQILRSFGVSVCSSHDIGDDSKLLEQHEISSFLTRDLYHTKKEVEETVTESVRDIYGEGSTLLLYSYKQTPMVAPDGMSQLRCYLPKHPSKPGTFTMAVDSTVGTWATRFDSLISHLCVMKGFPDAGCGEMDPNFDFRLPTGRLAPAVYTDEQVRAAGYCYGTLAAVPDSGDGHWTPPSTPAGTHLALLREILAKGITTILHGRAFFAGPKLARKNYSQWAKNGFVVHSALVRGCIISERLENFARASLAHLSDKPYFAREFSKVASSPWSFI